MSKIAVFSKIAEGGPRENIKKWPIFWAKFGRLKKYEIQVAQQPNWYG